MKPVSILISAIGFCLTNPTFAAGGAGGITGLTVSPSSAVYKSKADTTQKFFLTEQTNNSTDGKQLIQREYTVGTRTEPSVETKTPLLNTYVPGLKPKGSEIVHGTNGSTGFIEQAWPINWLTIDDGALLFSTDVLPGRYSYLYKLNTFTGTVGNNPPNYDNQQAVLNIGERNNVPQTDDKALHHHSLLQSTIAAANGATALFFGEYNVGNQDPVALWKSTDRGDTWSKVIEWNTAGHQTGSIHAVVQNPYNGWIYMALGDDDTESGIVAWDGQSPAPPNNTPISQLGNYLGWKSLTGLAKIVSTGDLVFTANSKVVWIPDVHNLAAGEKLYGQRANFDLSGREQTGQVPYVNGITPIMGVKSEGTGFIYWTSARESTAAEQKIHVWKSTDSGSTWLLDTKLNVYNTATAIPQRITASGYDYLGVAQDAIKISGRGLEFVGNGQKTGSTVSFTSVTTTQIIPYPDSATTSKGQPITLAVTNNDINAEASTVEIVSGFGGTATYSDSTKRVITFTPDPNFVGNANFYYRLKTGANTSSITDVQIVVTDAASTAPVANSDSATTPKGQPVTLNLTSNDTNVGTNKVNIVNYPSSGNVAYADSSQTSVIYTPNTGFVGSDTFTYNLKSATGTSNTASVTVTVTNTTTPPPAGSAVATADAVSTSKGQAVTFNPASNDTNIGTSTVNIVGYPGHGNVAYSDNTSKSITYTPNATFTGTDTFTYNLKSSAGTSNTVTVTITVGGTTLPPGGAVANGDTMTTTKGKPVTLNLTSNDTNVGTSTVNIAGYPNNGNVAYSDSTKKSITYTPDATFVGSDSFTYNLKSASGTSNTATVSVKVQ